MALGSDIDTAILQGKGIEHLFQELEGKEQDAAQESRFMKGVQYLRSIKVPLENFKLALDLATPLTRLEPTVTTVLGVVASVTAVCESPRRLSIILHRQRLALALIHVGIDRHQSCQCGP